MPPLNELCTKTCRFCGHIWDRHTGADAHMARTVASEAKRHATGPVEPATDESPVPELPNELWYLIDKFVGMQLEDLGKLRLLNQSYAYRVKCLQYQMAVFAHFDKRSKQRRDALIRDLNDMVLSRAEKKRRKNARFEAGVADSRAKLVLVAMSRRYKRDMDAQREERVQFYELQLNTLRELRDKLASDEAWFL